MRWKSFFSLWLVAALAVLPKAVAQEIFCRVTVNSQGAGQMDPTIFQELTRQMQDFMNQRRRTNDQFANDERISCSIVLNITGSPRANLYEATATILATRPVYGTSLETVMFNYLDNGFTFEYVPGQPMEFDDLNPNYTDNLTSLLSFYAYLILGIDYDSFSKLGGKNFYIKADQIVQAAQQAPFKGWKPSDGTNSRNWLIENYLNQQLIPFREGIYYYHRMGLDKFEQDPEAARARVLDMLQRIRAIQQVKPMSIAMNSWLNAKGLEIVNIFKQAQQKDKTQAYQVLMQIDPTGSNTYQQLQQ